VIIPASSKRQQPGGVVTKSKKMCTSRAGEMSTTSGVIEVPLDLELGGKTDYLEMKTMYEKFWTECQECFVWNVDTKYAISIDQMERAPKD
jgi:hypothetical protein